MTDVFLMREEGARMLLCILLASQVNQRSRRTVASVSEAWMRDRRRQPDEPRVKWYGTLLRSFWGIYRAYRTYALPRHSRVSTGALTERLRRATRRELGWTGAMSVDLPTLEARAAARIGMGSGTSRWCSGWTISMRSATA